MIIGFWNIRGLHGSSKQKEISSLVHGENIDLFCVLESKLSPQSLNNFWASKFRNWVVLDNFCTHSAGRIFVIFNPAKIKLHLLDVSPQTIHCNAACSTTSKSFRITFAYGYHSIVARRALWDSFQNYGADPQVPWLVMGDFNTIMNSDERCNMAPITSYDTKDFVNCCNDLGLTDMNSSGCHYTFSCAGKFSKLDRALINGPWLQSGWHSHANFRPPGTFSDHSLCLISIFDHNERSNRPFKFFNMWSQHPSFGSIVTKAWQQNVLGTAQFSFCRKQQRLKHPLKQLNLKEYSHISARVKRAKNELEIAQIDAMNNPQDSQKLLRVENLRHNSVLLCEAEICFLRQLAKCEHLKNSDRCTKFFHGMVKRNSKRNHIAAITKQDGSLTTSNDQVVTEFLEYYEGLLGTRDPCQPIDMGIIHSGNRLTPEQGEELTRSATDSEIKAAVFDIGDDKAPGPDGFSAGFYKKSWDIIGGDFCDAVKEFFSSGQLLKQINHTIIALVPKSTHSPMVTDFRPISCCNILYKVITKILAARVETVLDSIIDNAQSAFIQGRRMSDNIHLVQELLKGYNHKRVSNRCILKVDLRKAFDSVSWEFLTAILIGLNFPEHFVAQIMECVSTPSFSVAINGSIHGHFKGKKGLRQGDPLSPYLFVLCLEYLSRLLNYRTRIAGFNYHPQCGALRITHLAFADDLMLMSRGDAPSVRILMDCLDTFRKCSGLCANSTKSSLFTAGVSNHDLNEIQDLTGFDTGSMPFRYLGIPMAADKLRMIHYEPFVAKIAAYINAWSRVTLSYAGRAELIKSVLQGVESFWLSILPVPITVSDKIVSLCRKFLWRSNHPLVSWSQCCLPKSEGGLGFRDMKAWNRALLTKCLWNIHQKNDTLWIKWISQKYLSRDTIWTWKGKSNDSPLIQRILNIRDQILTSTGTATLAENLLHKWNDPSASTLDSRCSYDFFRIRVPEVLWHRDVWNPCIIPKQAFILWLSIKKKLKTKDKLPLQGIDRTCALCNQTDESISHLFFSCSHSSYIWTGIRKWVGISRAMTSVDSALKYIRKEGRGTGWQAKAKRVALANTIYAIWNERNKTIFEGTRFDKEAVCFKIKTNIFKILFARKSSRVRQSLLCPDLGKFPRVESN
ncbi:hypothetical protein RND71_034630 [Anisodus tanguticus]|uniref:Reverse transcriptase domain-containing protein n=1 Tax=Anisodus tanguticus TaxID=243964 RepID=A0AAE1RBQ8_9SOLA|nr:hypothetical protein RND71_034630 [Anisodus tanguticus]